MWVWLLAPEILAASVPGIPPPLGVGVDVAVGVGLGVGACMRECVRA